MSTHSVTLSPPPVEQLSEQHLRTIIHNLIESGYGEKKLVMDRLRQDYPKQYDGKTASTIFDYLMAK